MEGCYAECGPGEGSEDDRDEVGDLSLAVRDEVEQELDSGEADQCGE